MKKMLAVMATGLCFFLTCGKASAQIKEKEFTDWAVYTADMQGKKICYIVSLPKGQTGNYTKRDDPYLMVTRVDADTFEVSASSGYKYKINSDVKADIDGEKYNMFTKGELSWANDNKQDQKMVAAMKKGSDMKIQGTSVKASYSVDKYSLSGFSDAFDNMNEICK